MTRFSRFSLVFFSQLIACNFLISGELTNLSVEELRMLFEAAVRKPELPLSMSYVVETTRPPPTEAMHQAELERDQEMDTRSLAHLDPDTRKKVLEAMRADAEKRFREMGSNVIHGLWKGKETVDDKYYKQEEIVYRTSKPYDPKTIDSLPVIGHGVQGIAFDATNNAFFEYSIQHHLKSVSVDRRQVDEKRMSKRWRAFGMELEEFGGPIILALGKRNLKERWNRRRDGIENSEFDSAKASFFAKGGSKSETIQGESIVWSGIECRRILIQSKIPELLGMMPGSLVPRNAMEAPIVFEYIFNRTNFSLFYYGRYDNPHERIRHVSIREGFDSNGMPRIWKTSGFIGEDTRESFAVTHFLEYQFGIKTNLLESFRFEVPSGYSVSEIGHDGVGRPVATEYVSVKQKRLLIMALFVSITALGFWWISRGMMGERFAGEKALQPGSVEGSDQKATKL